ncbi:MBL fold metallo-hydrolase [Acidianus manzaensis]|uniref:MBL fold metallo-hydrolase n=1 Tax=Acidianus manzaensis TaxID=282676 RepID=A0A1W6K1M4_9CREN|nr:MBL fold metallo-hydrolase [Acidianus manzaensis]ARM76451.1 MBL fold metallo-hydrolase [Acidianus manzaensis]
MSISRKIHKPYVLYEDKDHKFVWLGLDESEHEKGILTNQYLIVDNNEGALLDAGGYFVFERVYENVKEFINPQNIKYLLFSHQDPDVIGSLNLWIDVTPDAKIYASGLWERFLPHLGFEDSVRIIDIPDEGMNIKLGNDVIKAIPAHFMHSPGNFHYYDTKSKIYFSGDLGAAVYPAGVWYLFVENFEEHVKYMEGFHRRYIASAKAIRNWLKHLEGLDIQIIAPQHGSIFQGENVKKFIEWLKSLDKTGMDYLWQD